VNTRAFGYLRPNAFGAGVETGGGKQLSQLLTCFGFLAGVIWINPHLLMTASKAHSVLQLQIFLGRCWLHADMRCSQQTSYFKVCFRLTRLR